MIGKDISENFKKNDNDAITITEKSLDLWMLKNSKKLLTEWQVLVCRGWNETVNQIISKYGKLIQKVYKTLHDWVGKVIY